MIALNVDASQYAGLVNASNNGYGITKQILKKHLDEFYYVHHYPDPVNVRNGNLYLGFEDIYIPGRLPLTIFRAYNSLTRNLGSFGYGWTMNYDIRVTEHKFGYIQVKEADGFINKFTKKGTDSALKKELSKSIIKEMRKKDKTAKQVKTKQYYLKEFKRLLTNDKYFRTLLARHKIKRKVPIGTYYSRARGNLKIKKFEKGYVLYKFDRTYFFSRRGGLKKIKDAFGHSLNFQYSRKGLLKKIIDDKGRKLEFFYDPALQLIKSIKDPLGREVRYEYNSKHHLISSYDFKNNKIFYEYLANHKMLSITYPNKGTVKFKYNTENGGIASQIGPAHKITKYVYGGDTKKRDYLFTKLIDTHGNFKKYEYDLTRNKYIITERDGSKKVYYMSKTCKLPAKVIDEEGRVTEYTYYKEGRLKTLKNALGQTTELFYNKNGQIIKISDHLGVYTYQYNTHGKLVRVNFLNSLSYKYQYNKVGDLAIIFDPLGNKKYLTYDKYGNIESITFPNGASIKFYNDIVGKVTKITDSNQNFYTFKYDKNNNVTEILNPFGGRVKYSYNNMNDIVSTKDANGNEVLYKYNILGLISEFKDPFGNVHNYIYDNMGLIKEFKNVESHVTRYYYDKKYRITDIVDPYNNIYKYAYSPVGNIQSVFDPTGNKWTYEYDGLNRILRRVDPNFNKLFYKYNKNGNLAEVVTKGGNRTVFKYNNFNKITILIKPDGSKVLYSYDRKGNLNKIENELGLATNFLYDASGNTIKIIDGAGREVTFGYDPNNNLVSITDQNKSNWKFVYDSLDRIIEAFSPSLNKVSFTYDNTGNLVKLIDGKGITTSYSYDKANRLRTIKDASEAKRTYVYGKVGNRTEFVDEEGNVKEFIYNKLNKVTKVIADGEAIKEFKYDKNGNIILAKNNDVETRFSYDNLNRVVQYSDNLTKNKVIYEYDKENNKTKVFVPGLIDIDYLYDKNGNLTKITADNKYFINIKYNKAGKRALIIYPNSIYAKYLYNEYGELGSIEMFRGNERIYKENYTFDPSGNPISKKIGRTTFKYKYDKDGNLINVFKNGNTYERFFYDKGGNRIKYINKGKTFNYTVNTLNQLVKVNNKTLIYDKRGNLSEVKTKSGNLKYVYNEDDYLIEVFKNDKRIAKFTYDAFGRRIAKQGATGKRIYLFDGIDRLCEFDSKKRKVKSYVYGDMFNDPLIELDSPGTPTFFIKDFLNSVIGTTDINGKVKNFYEYLAFGEFAKTKKQYPDFAYTGQAFDSETNLLYLPNRYYNPSWGRFITKDPIGLAGGTNPYIYANNSPYKYVDPLGLFSIGRPFIPTRGDKYNLGFINVDTLPESFPSLPTFPNPGDINGYGNIYGRKPTGTAIFVNVNHAFYPGSGQGGGGAGGISGISTLGVLGKVLGAAFYGTAGISLGAPHDSLSMFRQLSIMGNINKQINVSNIIGTVYRSPIAFAKEAPKWLWRDILDVFYFYFPKRDDPHFVTPFSGTPDFLNIPKMTNPFAGKAYSMGANRYYQTNNNPAQVESVKIFHKKKMDKFKDVESVHNNVGKITTTNESITELPAPLPVTDDVINSGCY